MNVYKPLKLGSQPVKSGGNYEHNLQDDSVAPEWTVNITVKPFLTISAHCVSGHPEVPAP